MQLEGYIKDLLYRYECVIVPGFGAFLTRYRSATIDPATHTFHPPSKLLSFNRQLQTNDGLLANYVAGADQCSYETALQRIRAFTARLSSKLNEGQEVELKGIGNFNLNGEGAVQFLPTETENFNTASFGLASFSSPIIEREVAASLGHTKNQSEKIKTLSTRPAIPYMRYAAIGLIALALGGVGGMKIYEGKVQQHNFAEKQKANAIVEGEIQEATFVISNPLPSITVSVPKQQGKYHIVAGAFRIEENAHKKMQQLQEKGYSPRLIGENRYGLHQVVYRSFEQRTEAVKTLLSIQKTENKDAWLLVKDLTSE